jgi:hypothetical protein
MKFKHKITGIVEDVTNASIIPQYLSHSDTYEKVKEKAEEKPKAPKTAKSK